MNEYFDNQTTAEVAELIGDMWQPFLDALQSVFDVFKTFITEKFDEMKDLLERMCGSYTYFCTHYENRRVVWLSLHAKKQRTRKKNLHRLLNDYRKSLQGGKLS